MLEGADANTFRTCSGVKKHVSVCRFVFIFIFAASFRHKDGGGQTYKIAFVCGVF